MEAPRIAGKSAPGLLMWEGSTPGASTKICHRLASAIERGAGSFSAEQFIEILRLFNVPVSHVASEARADPDSALQNLLARLGASELHESDALPSERILDSMRRSGRHW